MTKFCNSFKCKPLALPSMLQAKADT